MFGWRFASPWLGNHGHHRRKPARYRPIVQVLEDRYLLSTFHEFPLPPLQREPTERITAGSDGNLWFTDGVRGRAVVGRISPEGSVTQFSIEDNTTTQLYNITTGPDGNLWMLAIRTPSFTSHDQLVVIRMTPDGNYTVFGAFLRHSDEDFISNLSTLAVGSDGNLWYDASFYSNFPSRSGQGSIVGRITPTGDVTNFDAGLNDAIAEFGIGGGITTGVDGNVWIGLDGVRPFSPDGQWLDRFPGSRPLSDMVTVANGNVWGLMRPGPMGSLVEQIAPDGTVSDFPLPVREPIPNPEPVLDPSRMTITAGPDGNIWFSDPYANQIGNIAPDGTVTEYAVPTPNSFPTGITPGPDGNIWFTELGSGQIGEFVLNDGGGGSGAAPAKSAPLAPSVRSAAVDAFFAGAQPDLLRAVAMSQQPALAAVDAAVSSSRPEAVPTPKAQQTVADAGTMHRPHQVDQAEAADAGLADPLAVGLVVIV